MRATILAVGLISALLAAAPSALAQQQTGPSSGHAPALTSAIDECESGAMTLTNGARALGACDFALRADRLSDTERARLFVNRAALALDRGNAAAARADLERAEALEPNMAELHLNRSAALISAGDYPAAARAAQRALEAGLRPAALGHFNHAIALERMGRREEAYDAYSEAARLAPSDSRFASQTARLGG